MTFIIILAGFLVTTAYAVVYAGAVFLGQSTLRRARRTPGGESAREYTFVGRPLGAKFYNPWLAESWFSEEKFATVQDPAVVRRARLVKRLIHLKYTLLPVAFGACVVMLIVLKLSE
jgi:hypothetical protein